MRKIMSLRGNSKASNRVTSIGLGGSWWLCTNLTWSSSFYSKSIWSVAQFESTAFFSWMQVLWIQEKQCWSWEPELTLIPVGCENLWLLSSRSLRMTPDSYKWQNDVVSISTKRDAKYIFRQTLFSFMFITIGTEQ